MTISVLEICEKIYLSFLTLTLLRTFKQTAGFVKDYSNQTLTYGEFTRVRTTANDLHNMLAIVAGNPEIVQKLANKNAAMALRQRQKVPVLAIKRYLRTFKDSYKFLTQLEKALSISAQASIFLPFAHHCPPSTPPHPLLPQRRSSTVSGYT